MIYTNNNKFRSSESMRTRKVRQAKIQYNKKKRRKAYSKGYSHGAIDMSSELFQGDRYSISGDNYGISSFKRY